MENRFITPTVRSLTSEQLVFEHELGEGGFGCVIQAQLDGQDVAVKQLLHPNKNAFAQFQLELHHLARAQDSEYIIKLVGAVYYRSVCYMLVTELCSEGTLDKFVINSDACTPEIIALLDDARCGIVYLHQKNIMHCDIKPLNILVKPRTLINRTRAKICDFGLATTLSENKTLRGCQGTPGFCAPEIEKDVYSLAADVFAYGQTAACIFNIIHIKKPNWINKCRCVHPNQRPNLQILIIKKLCPNAVQGQICPHKTNCWFDHSAPVFVKPAMKMPSLSSLIKIPTKVPIKIKLVRPYVSLSMQEMKQLVTKKLKDNAALET
jgi:serine/threonine protein kinase